MFHQLHTGYPKTSSSLWEPWKLTAEKLVPAEHMVFLLCLDREKHGEDVALFTPEQRSKDTQGSMGEGFQDTSHPNTRRFTHGGKLKCCPHIAMPQATSQWRSSVMLKFNRDRIMTLWVSYEDVWCFIRTLFDAQNPYGQLFDSASQDTDAATDATDSTGQTTHMCNQLQTINLLHVHAAVLDCSNSTTVHGSI